MFVPVWLPTRFVMCVPFFFSSYPSVWKSFAPHRVQSAADTHLPQDCPLHTHTHTHSVARVMQHFCFISLLKNTGKNSSVSSNVSVWALPLKIKFKSALVGRCHSFVFVNLGAKQTISTYGATAFFFFNLSPALSLCSDDITRWRSLQPILSCSCFVFFIC